MITFFTAPKAMTGDAARLQRNAIGSWRFIGDDAQVVVVGDDPGVAEAAAELGVQHVGGVATNEYGTPRLDAVFGRSRSVARHQLLCFANADIVFRRDLAAAASMLGDRFRSFLAVGESWDAPMEHLLDFDASWELDVERALADARRRGAGRSTSSSSPTISSRSCHPSRSAALASTTGSSGRPRKTARRWST